MKYIKTFENNYHDFLTGQQQNKPTVGDYILCETKYNRTELSYFMTNNIGKIIEEDVRDEDNIPIFLVEYEKLPKVWSIPKSDPPNKWLSINFIKYWSKDKNEI